MPDATMKDFGELVTAVMLDGRPILPRPEWGQDAAYLAWCFDSAFARAEGWEETLDELLKHVPDWATTSVGSETVYLAEGDYEIPREALAVLYVRWLEERVFVRHKVGWLDPRVGYYPHGKPPSEGARMNGV